MRCKNCGNEIEEGSLFCIHCGSKVESNLIPCPGCGKLLEPGTKFCTACGYDLLGTQTQSIPLEKQEERQTRRIFKKINEYIKSEKYEQALEMMEDIKDEEDVSALMEKCLKKANEKINELSSENSIESKKKAIALLEVIEDYQDVDKSIKKLKSEIQNIEEMQRQEAAGKKKKITIIAVIVGLICVAIIGFFVLQSSKPQLVLTSKTIELGEKVVLEPSLFVDTTQTKNIDVKTLEMETELLTDKDKYIYDEASNKVVSKDMGYLDVGVYKIKISTSDGKASGEVQLTIEDTTAPTFTKVTNTISVDQGAKDVDLTKYFTASDYSKVDVTFDKKSIDYNKAGSYTVTATAKDAYGNQTTVSSTVKVVAAPTPSVSQSTSSSTSSNTNSSISTDFPSGGYSPGSYRLGCNMKVRSGPGTSYSSPKTLPVNTVVNVTDVTQNSDGSYWGRISEGYICLYDYRGPYLFRQ